MCYLLTLKTVSYTSGVHEVSIQLDLETMFQFSHLVMTFKVPLFFYLRGEGVIGMCF